MLERGDLVLWKGETLYVETVTDNLRARVYISPELSRVFRQVEVSFDEVKLGETNSYPVECNPGPFVVVKTDNVRFRLEKNKVCRIYQDGHVTKAEIRESHLLLPRNIVVLTQRFNKARGELKKFHDLHLPKDHSGKLLDLVDKALDTANRARTDVQQAEAGSGKNPFMHYHEFCCNVTIAEDIIDLLNSLNFEKYVNLDSALKRWSPKSETFANCNRFKERDHNPHVTKDDQEFVYKCIREVKQKRLYADPNDPDDPDDDGDELEAPHLERNTDTVPLSDQGTDGTCYAHAIARCFTRLISVHGIVSERFPDVVSVPQKMKLFNTLKRILIDKYGRDGAPALKAMEWLLSAQNPEMAVIIPKNERDKLEVKKIHMSDKNAMTEVRSAIAECREPVSQFFYTKRKPYEDCWWHNQWDQFHEADTDIKAGSIRGNSVRVMEEGAWGGHAVCLYNIEIAEGNHYPGGGLTGGGLLTGGDVDRVKHKRQRKEHDVFVFKNSWGNDKGTRCSKHIFSATAQSLCPDEFTREYFFCFDLRYKRTEHSEIKNRTDIIKYVKDRTEKLRRAEEERRRKKEEARRKSEVEWAKIRREEHAWRAEQLRSPRYQYFAHDLVWAHRFHYERYVHLMNDPEHQTYAAQRDILDRVTIYAALMKADWALSGLSEIHRKEALMEAEKLEQKYKITILLKQTVAYGYLPLFLWFVWALYSYMLVWQKYPEFAVSTTIIATICAFRNESVQNLLQVWYHWDYYEQGIHLIPQVGLRPLYARVRVHHANSWLRSIIIIALASVLYWYFQFHIGLFWIFIGCSLKLSFSIDSNVPFSLLYLALKMSVASGVIQFTPHSSEANATGLLFGLAFAEWMPVFRRWVQVEMSPLLTYCVLFVAVLYKYFFDNHTHVWGSVRIEGDSP